MLLSYEEFVRFLLSQTGSFATCTYDFNNKNVTVPWYESLKHLSYEQFLKAFRTARDNIKFFPSIKEILDYADPSSIKLDSKLEAEVIKSRIMYAISAYGYTNPEKAQKHIGPLGWKFIQTRGGWSQVCDITYDDVKSFGFDARYYCEAHLIQNPQIQSQTDLQIEGKRPQLLQSAIDLIIQGQTSPSLNRNTLKGFISELSDKE